MLLVTVVKGIVLVLLLAATLVQPSLALPATCTMPGPHQMVTCAGCCANSPCCAVSVRAQAERLTVVAVNSAVDQSSGVAASFPVAIFCELSPPARNAEASGYKTVSHSPPPLALSCIRLI